MANDTGSDMDHEDTGDDFSLGDRPMQTAGAPEVGGGLSGPDDPDLTRQRLIDELVAEYTGHLPDEAVAALEQKLAAAGLPPMPDPWLRAVAESAAQGNPYVVSRGTLGEVDVPAPATRDETYGKS